ncbi:MAG: outer membrane lipoprotein-sorting protein [Bryobacteraceae bacterium]
MIDRMVLMDHSRATALDRYTSLRHYSVGNQRFEKDAEETVQEFYNAPDKKRFEVVSVAGSPYLRQKVIDRLLEAEIASVGDEKQDQSHITPRNYTFDLTGTESIDGHFCYVLEVKPKVAKKYLMRGRIWVDATDFAIVRMEGSPAHNPSFWTRKIHFIRRYEKHGAFWLPASTVSEADLFVAGKSTLRIDYSDYRISAQSDASLSPDVAAR